MNRALLLICLLFAWALPAGAQQKAHAKLFARAEGDLVRAVLQVKIDPGWHLYHEFLGDGGGIGQETVLNWGGDGIVWSPTRYPEPLKLPQEGLTAPDGSEAWIYGYDGKVLFYALGRFEPGPADASRITLEITGLTCEDGGSCIPYSDEPDLEGPGDDALFAKFPTDLVPGAKPTPPPDAGASESTEGAEPDEPIAAGASLTVNDPAWDAFSPPEFQTRPEPERSLVLWLVFAFIAGAVLNVMPCVLPVVSIKILSFVQQAGESKSRVFHLGLAFAAGILAVFAVLALLAAFAGLSWGEQFQSEPFKIVMVAVVFAFSLSLFDVFELGVPSKVGELASVKREGMRDAFFKGVMATVLATPCSGPFLGSTLAWAVAQPAHVIVAVFLMVGVGMASPYVVLTSNPGLLKFVPKPGAWMHTFKQATGFLLLGTVVFLLIGVRQDLLLFTAAMLVFVALGCWWWGKYATFEQTSLQRARTLIVALCLAGGGAAFAFGPLRNAMTPGASGELAWEDFDPHSFERYQREGRPVMLDFTADW